MTNEFLKLGIIDELVAGLKKADIIKPTAIQAKVIPAVMLGKDIIAQSATGTGKTLAYLLPILQKIDVEKKVPQALILAPTHELAIQILRQLELIISNSGIAITAAPIIGNVNISRQIEKLRDKLHIIVGSSGRILELIKKRKISSQTIMTIVLDEADRLLDDNNVEAVISVIKTTLKERQLLLLSATITEQVLQRAKGFMQEAQVIYASDEQHENINKNIKHMYFVTEQRDKIDMLRRLVRSINIERALVFINLRYDIQLTCDKLNYVGLKSAGIHGSSIKTERQRALEDFRSGRIQLLVASNLAARGLDISNVDYIFNLDMPEDAKLYLHRVGRTGRAGKNGTAISIISKAELGLVRKHEKALKIEIVPKVLNRGFVTVRR